MPDPGDALRTQIRNIERDTQRSVAEWATIVWGGDLVKHGQILAHLKTTYGLTYGNANALAHAIRALEAEPSTDEELLDQQYRGVKAAMRLTYDELIAVARSLGDDVEVAVKKTGVSLRRQRQFALIEVPSASRVRLGLNLKGIPETNRLRAATGMCTHSVDITDPNGVDDELAAWMRQAYRRAT